MRSDVPTGNELSVLHEVRHALEKLIVTGEATVIDLRGIPMAPMEEGRIEAVLGKGEVEATLNALGPSEVRETQIPGVWLVVHYNSNAEIMSKFIEITLVPSILKSQEADMRNGLERLQSRLEELDRR